MPLLFTSTTTAQDVQSNAFVDIQGLNLILPSATATTKEAIVTLNIPSPYATGDDYPGIDFAVAANGGVVAQGSMSYSEKNPGNPGRIPFTLVAKIPLGPNQKTVTAQWRSVRGSSIRIDTFSSISAIIG